MKKYNKINQLALFLSFCAVCNLGMAQLTKDAGKANAETSRDALFGLDKPVAEKENATQSSVTSKWRGYVQAEAARAYRDPAHWSKERLRLDLNRQGQLGEQVKWKIGGRLDYDAAYDQLNFYPPAVRQDQRWGFALRENYLDIGAGDWDIRLGRQHVIWGEMVGLFFADVVSAKDMREFLLPEFDQLRIPQWAARVSYNKNDTNLDLLWIPVPTFDNIGKPGADFFPYPLPVQANYLGEAIPSRKLDNSNYGVRLSSLKSGWDFSGFYYHSLDAAPTFYRMGVPAAPPAPLIFQARHDKIDQVGGTVSKDLGATIFKGELVYTDGRKFNVTRLAQPDGLVKQNTLDYAMGLDFTFGADTRLNFQAFQRVFFDHDPGIIADKLESGVSLFALTKLARNVEAQTLLVHSLNRRDWMLRPRVTWGFEKNWRVAVGADIFSGPQTGFFGRYNGADRIYTELRYAF
jgi:hypothetical protein